MLKVESVDAAGRLVGESPILRQRGARGIGVKGCSISPDRAGVANLRH